MAIDTPLPPSSQLPPIKRISSFPVEHLSSSVRYLRRIYNPSVRGSRLRRRRSSSVSTSPSRTRARKASISTSSKSDPLDALRTDAYERSYAIRWLMALISYLGSEESFEEGALHSVENLLQDAASLLAVCAGTASAGVITRDLVFALGSSHSPQSDLVPASDLPDNIAITLTDIPLENHDYGSVGAQTWGGACVMAEMIIENPRQFGLMIERGNDGGIITATADGNTASSSNARPLRVLELGAGTGLVSLAAAKILQHQLGRVSPMELVPEVEVLATDYYPSVLANLKVNVRRNFPHPADDLVKVSTHPLDWSMLAASSEACQGTTIIDDVMDVTGGNLHTIETIELESDTPQITCDGMDEEAEQNSDSGPSASPFERPFDIILGADIIYEAEHAVWIKACLLKLLRRPEGSNSVCTSSSPCESLFHLIIPLRSTHTAESETIEKVFPLEACCGDNTTQEGRTPQLVIKSKIMLLCDADTGRNGDEVEYAYYKIGWCC